MILKGKNIRTSSRTVSWLLSSGDYPLLSVEFKQITWQQTEAIMHMYQCDVTNCQKMRYVK